MFELLATEIEKWPVDADGDDPMGACIVFNDDEATDWRDIETLIHGAIGQARRIKVPA